MVPFTSNFEKCIRIWNPSVKNTFCLITYFTQIVSRYHKFNINKMHNRMRFRSISSTLTAFFAALPVLSQVTTTLYKQNASLKHTLLKKRLSRILLLLCACVCKSYGFERPKEICN